VYSVGQGIGLYRSWALLALTQHFIVKLAARSLKLDNFMDYIVLGDDIVIANEDVANRYIDIISVLGVEISKPKRIVPREDFCGIEFASQLFTKGERVTQLPFGLVLEGGSLSLFSL
jgi:hypothetical protein